MNPSAILRFVFGKTDDITYNIFTMNISIVSYSLINVVVEGFWNYDRLSDTVH